MMHFTKTIRFMLGCVLLVAVGNIGAAASAQEQQNVRAKPTPKRVYDGGRDPFRKYEVSRPAVKKLANVVLTPSIQERIAQYRAQKAAAMNARMPAPKPTTALLLSEMKVIGISRSPRGYAAIVEATPIKLSYVLYPGERFYDGQLVAIEDNRLIFRRDIVFTDGRRERSVEIKALRQPGSTEDMMATKPASVSSTIADPERKAEEKSSTGNNP